jgi:flagellar hook-associated protein 1 FlgK
MPNIYGLLSVSQTALMTQQKAIDITGNNIANVNTPGYSRQRLNMEQNEPIRYDGGQMSTGVRADRKIQRIYDRFVNGQIAYENQQMGRWEAQQQTLEKAELTFDEATGYGLNNAMSSFWTSWQELANNPTGQVERTTLLANSQNLTDSFNKLSIDLTEVRQEADISMANTVDQINPLTQQLAELNLKIGQVEAGGQNANDYRDERDQLLKELSQLIDIQSFEDGDGHLHVDTANGKVLVDRGSSWELTTAENGSGFQDIFWMDSQGNPANITSQISGGKLKGWIEARDVVIPDYLNRIDTLALGIINSVNAIHSSGYALDGTTTGLNFFSGSGAADISVDGAIEADVDLIAASATAAGAPGDESNAIAMANLQNSVTVGGTTFDDYYNSIINDVGSDVFQATTYNNHQQSMLSSLESHREEVSGVSLDEEMVNLLKFQHAYQAAAKLVTTVDDLLQTVMDMI